MQRTVLAADVSACNAGIDFPTNVLSACWYSCNQHAILGNDCELARHELKVHSIQIIIY